MPLALLDLYEPSLFLLLDVPRVLLSSLPDLSPLDLFLDFSFDIPITDCKLFVFSAYSKRLARSWTRLPRKICLN